MLVRSCETPERARVEKKEKEAERKKNASLRILSFPHIKEKCRGTNEPYKEAAAGLILFRIIFPLRKQVALHYFLFAFKPPSYPFFALSPSPTLFNMRFAPIFLAVSLALAGSGKSHVFFVLF